MIKCMWKNVHMYLFVPFCDVFTSIVFLELNVGRPPGRLNIIAKTNRGMFARADDWCVHADQMISWLQRQMQMLNLSRKRSLKRTNCFPPTVVYDSVSSLWLCCSSLHSA